MAGVGRLLALQYHKGHSCVQGEFPEQWLTLVKILNKTKCSFICGKSCLNSKYTRSNLCLLWVQVRISVHISDTSWVHDLLGPVLHFIVTVTQLVLAHISTTDTTPSRLTEKTQQSSAAFPGGGGGHHACGNHCLESSSVVSRRFPAAVILYSGDMWWCLKSFLSLRTKDATGIWVEASNTVWHASVPRAASQQRIS